MSRKLEVIIERIKTLNKEELKQLSNEVDAEIQFRDIDSRMIIDSREKDKNVWGYIMGSYNSNSLIFNRFNFWLMKICYNCEYPMEEQEFNNPYKPEDPEIWFYCEVCERHDNPNVQEDEVLTKWHGDVIWKKMDNQNSFAEIVENFV